MFRFGGNMKQSEFSKRVERFKLHLIKGYLQESNGNINQIEKLKGVPRATIYRLLKKFRIDYNKYRKQGQGQL